MIIIQVTYKVFIVFSPKEILLDPNAFLISTSLKKIRVLLRESLFFSISISPNVRIYLTIFMFYSVMLFFVKLVFCIKFMVSLLLIPLIMQR